jgi:phosphotriesterase-related protein
MSTALVNTTAGPLAATELGFVLTHEHVLIASPEVRVVWPESFDTAAAQRRVVARLAAARAAGVNTLVDLTTIDFGRDAQFVQQAARSADLPVVICTGLWNVPLYFQWRPAEVAEQFFVKEIVDGIEGSELKAGVIKITSNAELLTPAQDTIFRAAARAHRRTGVPIMTNTEASQRSGLDQQRVLAEEGVDLTRVVIGHSETEDFEYLLRLLDRGSLIGVDRFGWAPSDATRRLGRPSHAQRLRIVAELCRRGYAGQVLLSHDTAGLSVFDPEVYDREHPDSRFDFIPTTVLGELQAAGVSAAEIALMSRDNPRTLFSRQDTY